MIIPFNPILQFQIHHIIWFLINSSQFSESYNRFSPTENIRTKKFLVFLVKMHHCRFVISKNIWFFPKNLYLKSRLTVPKSFLENFRADFKADFWKTHPIVDLRISGHETHRFVENSSKPTIKAGWVFLTSWAIHYRKT